MTDTPKPDPLAPRSFTRRVCLGVLVAWTAMAAGSIFWADPEIAKAVVASAAMLTTGVIGIYAGRRTFEAFAK